MFIFETEIWISISYILQQNPATRSIVYRSIWFTELDDEEFAGWKGYKFTLHNKSGCAGWIEELILPDRSFTSNLE